MMEKLVVCSDNNSSYGFCIDANPRRNHL